MEDWMLTKTQIRSHLKKKWRKKGNCVVCGANEWVVVDEEYCIPDITRSKDFPVSVVYCEKCGAMILLSSDIIKREFR